jgi:nucleotidyltransferase substrate binding protein (TIGR01987 family)
VGTGNIMTTKLNLNALEKATTRLQEALDYSNSDLAKQDAGLFQQFRNSVIQCFEFTYELCCKMLERQLMIILPASATTTKLAFNDLLREAAQYGLIESPEHWIQYRRERNVTSSIYDDDMAQEVYAITPKFLPDAKKLLNVLKAKNNF